MRSKLESSFWMSVALFVLAVAFQGATASTVRADENASGGESWKNLPARAMVEHALRGTLYYEFDHWFPKFEARIAELESKPESLTNRIERMKFHFYLAGLLAEFSHVLSFTSKFKVDSIKERFALHSGKAKELATEILDEDGLAQSQKATALFYLGASEGYMGIVEYGAGNFISALLNGLNADNHLEEALKLDAGLSDAYVGLGIYRYGNTRIGGISNFLMQGGEDLRLVGLQHLEHALQKDIIAKPLAMKTLIWFYISEEINPENQGLPASDSLSPAHCRKRALQLIGQYEKIYFKSVDQDGFIGNQGLAMMKAIQFVLDANYAGARDQFQQVLKIVNHLKSSKGYKINPQMTDTVKEGIRFSELMLAGARKPDNRSVCIRVNKQIEFIENGGSIVEYESKKIRGELQDVFYQRLQDLSEKKSC